MWMPEDLLFGRSRISKASDAVQPSQIDSHKDCGENDLTPLLLGNPSCKRSLVGLVARPTYAFKHS